LIEPQHLKKSKFVYSVKPHYLNFTKWWLILHD